MTRVLLDVNVLLDVFLSRAPWLADSAAVFQTHFDGKVAAHLSAASLPTVCYLVRRNADLERAHSVIKECLVTFTIIPVDRQALALAATLPGSDFEDNLQIACASLAKLDGIVTRDPRGFAGSAVAALAPSEFLAQIPREDPA